MSNLLLLCWHECQACCISRLLEAQARLRWNSMVTVIIVLVTGYIRGGDAAFMGLDKKTGWRGGRRLLRELGHGVYLLWMLLNFAFVWAVGVSRFTDNKHNISDIEGGWLLGFAFALIYAARSTCLHKYVIMHGVRGIDELQRASQSVSGLPPATGRAVPAL